MKKIIFSSFIVAWASLDLPTLGGALIFFTGLLTAGYIWVRWGLNGNNKRCKEERV